MSDLLFWAEFFGRCAVLAAPIAGLCGLAHVLIVPSGYRWWWQR